MAEDDFKANMRAAVRRLAQAIAAIDGGGIDTPAVQALIDASIANVTTQLQALVVAIDEGDDADQAGLAALALQVAAIPAPPDLTPYATTAALAALAARVTALELAEPAVDETAIRALADEQIDAAGPFLKGVSQPEDPAGLDSDDPTYGDGIAVDFFWYDESTE